MLELAKAQYGRKDYPTAVATLQRLIALDATQDEAYYYLGCPTRR